MSAALIPSLSPKDWADLRIFVEIATHLSFGLAARRLALSQSTVSKCLARLERRHGVLLVHRTTRQVSLTPTGAALLEHLGHAMTRAGDLLSTETTTAPRPGEDRITA